MHYVLYGILYMFNLLISVQAAHLNLSACLLNIIESNHRLSSYISVTSTDNRGKITGESLVIDLTKAPEGDDLKNVEAISYAPPSPTNAITPDDHDMSEYQISESRAFGDGFMFRVLRRPSPYADLIARIIRLDKMDKGQIAEFPIERLALFRENIAEVSKTLDEVITGRKDVHLKTHLGGNMYVQVDSPFQGVSIRHFNGKWGHSDFKLIPSKGVFLKNKDWKAFLDLNKDMPSLIPEILLAVPCYMQSSHSNQEAAMTCPECFPNGENLHYFS